MFQFMISQFLSKMQFVLFSFNVFCLCVFAQGIASLDTKATALLAPTSMNVWLEDVHHLKDVQTLWDHLPVECAMEEDVVSLFAGSWKRMR